MLVIPADGDWAARRAAPRGDAGPCLPAGRRRDLPVVTWEEGERRPRSRGRDGPRCARPSARRDPFAIAVSDDLPARHLLRLQERLDGCDLRARVPDPRPAADRQGRRRDRAADRGGPRRRSGRRPDRRAAGWSGGPRRMSRVRSASGSSPRVTTRPNSRSSGPGPNSASPHHEASDRVIRGRRADRARYRRHRRRLRLGHHPHAVGDRRRSGEGSRRAVPPPVRRPARRPGGRDAGGPPGRHARGGRCRRARPDRGGGLRRGVLPPDRARDRPRGPRGPVHHRRQPRAAAAKGWPSRSSPGSTSSASTAPGSRTSWSAARMARSRSTRRLASCTSSTAEPGADPAPFARSRIGRAAVSSVDGSRPMRPACLSENA